MKFLNFYVILTILNLVILGYSAYFFMSARADTSDETVRVANEMFKESHADMMHILFPHVPLSEIEQAQLDIDIKDKEAWHALYRKWLKEKNGK